MQYHDNLVVTYFLCSTQYNVKFMSVYCGKVYSATPKSLSFHCCISYAFLLEILILSFVVNLHGYFKFVDFVQ